MLDAARRGALCCVQQPTNASDEHAAPPVLLSKPRLPPPAYGVHHAWIAGDTVAKVYRSERFLVAVVGCDCRKVSRHTWQVRESAGLKYHCAMVPEMTNVRIYAGGQEKQVTAINQVQL